MIGKPTGWIKHHVTYTTLWTSKGINRSKDSDIYRGVEQFNQGWVYGIWN